MSTSKHIDLVCVVVLLCALLVTVLFINGKALGIQVMADADAGDSQFTVNDRNADWDQTGATRITLTGDGGSVKGNGAYVADGDVHIVYAGKYVITGELSDGSILIDADGDDKIWILLNGVTLHCEDSAAIFVKQADKVFLTLAEGTENFISSGAEYSEYATSRSIDGAIYSKDDLTINGSGALTVTADYKHGIVCNDDLVIVDANIQITAVQDGIHAHDSIRLADMDLTVTAGDDGIHASNDDETSYIYIESGNIRIPACYEGIEAIDITIAGGNIHIRPTDDGINANGQGRNSVIRITGGDITIINETGRDADGLDSNGSLYISGGNIFISVNANGGSAAIDYGTENGGVAEISGGTIIAAGSSAMADGFDSSSQQNFFMCTTSVAAGGTTVTLQNQAGITLLSQTIPCAFSSLVISTPELQLGETCTLSIGDSTQTVTVDNTSGNGGFGGGKGGFGGRGDRNNLSGENQQQDMPEMPSDGFGNAPGGNMPGGKFPFDNSQMPEGDRQGDMRPNFGDRENGQWDTDRQGGNRFPQQQTQNSSQEETATISAEALIWVAASVITLSAALLFAFKAKH